MIQLFHLAIIPTLCHTDNILKCGVYLAGLYYIVILVIIGIGITVQRIRFDTSCLALGLPQMAVIFA